MISKLSVERISVDGSDFGTTPKDADYASDADRLQSLREAEQGRYSSFFTIERDTKSEVAERGRDDLWALRDYTGGVYILISNRLSEQNRRSVFIGMAGFNEKMFGPYERQTGINLQLEGEGRFMTLAQCLEEQNENPPTGMKYWDLAIVIPEEEHILQLFAVLYYIFDKAEGFIVRTTVNDEASDKLHYMNLVSQRYVSGIKKFSVTALRILINVLLIIPPNSWLPIVVGILRTVIDMLEQNKEKLSKEQKNLRKIRKSEKLSKQKDLNSDEDNDSDEEEIKNLVENKVKFLNRIFPRKSNSLSQKTKKLNDDFEECVDQ